ncbi:MAG: radical SAM protein [Deltaproteobacteria bacterium]|nr:radical SAM protein [Deltaproteobacteria bacterium]
MSTRPASLDRPSEQVLELPGPAGAVDLSCALVYPNRHGLGMANLGFQAVFALLSGLPGSLCHRAFSDYPRTVEAGRALRDYDLVALSLSFEGDYPEALRLLAAGGVALRSEARGSRDPFVLGGGVAVTLNPEPLAPFLDAVFLGEAEAGLLPLHAFLRDHRGLPRPELLEALADARVPGVYVPSRYDVAEADGRVLSRRPQGKAPETVARRWAECPWDPARTRISTPDDAFQGAYLLEISRGCPHACRFCAAGHATRPARFLPLETLEPFLRLGAREVGRLGLVGAAVSDHPRFKELAEAILDLGAGFTVSSFRAENLDEEVLALLARGGLKTLTVALEAGSERLRRRLGKEIGRDDVLRAARLAAGAGLHRLRIYAMVGLPGEADEDLGALAELATEARSALGGGTVTVSAAPFVPKAHTPFQWETMAPEPLLRSRIRLLEKLLGRRTAVRVVAETPKWSRVQGLLARGGRSIAPLLEQAAATGEWRAVLRSAEARAVLDRERDVDEALPWDVVTGGPSTEHLRRERAASLRGEPPVPCRPGRCSVCGVCPLPQGAPDDTSRSVCS